MPTRPESGDQVVVTVTVADTSPDYCHRNSRCYLPSLFESDDEESDAQTGRQSGSTYWRRAVPCKSHMVVDNEEELAQNDDHSSDDDDDDDEDGDEDANATSPVITTPTRASSCKDVPSEAPKQSAFLDMLAGKKPLPIPWVDSESGYGPYLQPNPNPTPQLPGKARVLTVWTSGKAPAPKLPDNPRVPGSNRCHYEFFQRSYPRCTGTCSRDLAWCRPLGSYNSNWGGPDGPQPGKLYRVARRTSAAGNNNGCKGFQDASEDIRGLWWAATLARKSPSSRS